MEIQIIADSCCDLTPTLRRVLRVRTASLTIRVDDGEFIDDENLDIPALMAAMKQSANAPTTACPAPEAYAAMMAQAPMTFVVTLSSRLSGSYNAACVGRDMALEANPSLKICVLDSESASAGETRIVMLLRDLIDAGLAFEEIEQRARAFIAPMRTRFVLEDLSHLVKNGRISKMAGFVGTVLNLRPLMADNGHGESHEKAGGTCGRRDGGCRAGQHSAGFELLQLCAPRAGAAEKPACQLCGVEGRNYGAHRRHLHRVCR